MQQMPLSALINTVDSGLPLIHEMLSEQICEYVPLAKMEDGERELLALQVTTRSPMGALAYSFAAIFIQHGFVRLLGAGRHPRIAQSITSASFGKFAASEIAGGPASTTVFRPGGLIVADDVLGGVFALSGGGVPGVALGHVGYFSPATQMFEDLGTGYSGFVGAMGSVENFHSFYSDMLWPGWEAEVRELSGDQFVSCYPPLNCRVGDADGDVTNACSDDGGRESLNVSKRSRKAVSISELELKWL